MEQLEATENYKEGPLIKPTELKTLTSFILPAPKVTFRATGKSWTPGFLAYATFSERLMQPEGCCSVSEAIAEGKESTGKEEWVQKRNFPHVTPSIFGSHVNREEDK